MSGSLSGSWAGAGSVAAECKTEKAFSRFISPNTFQVQMDLNSNSISLWSSAATSLEPLHRQFCCVDPTLPIQLHPLLPSSCADILWPNWSVHWRQINNRNATASLYPVGQWIVITSWLNCTLSVASQVSVRLSGIWLTPTVWTGSSLLSTGIEGGAGGLRNGRTHLIKWYSPSRTSISYRGGHT